MEKIETGVNMGLFDGLFKPKKPKEDYYKIGLELKKRGEYGAAEARFDWARREDWNNADAHAEWGRLRRQFLDYHNDHPEDVSDPVSRRMLLGYYDEVGVAFQTAIRLNPQNHRYHFEYARLLYDKMKWVPDEAGRYKLLKNVIEEYKNARKLNPNDDEVLDNLRYVYRELENKKVDGLQELRKILRSAAQFWKCPKCGMIWAKKEWLMECDPSDIQGKNTCDCGTAYDQKDVYGGQFDFVVELKRSTEQGFNKLNMVIFLISDTKPSDPLPISEIILHKKYPRTSVGISTIIGRKNPLTEEEAYADYYNFVKAGIIHSHGNQVEIYSGILPGDQKFVVLLFSD